MIFEATDNCDLSVCVAEAIRHGCWKIKKEDKLYRIAVTITRTSVVTDIPTEKQDPVTVHIAPPPSPGK